MLRDEIIWHLGDFLSLLDLTMHRCKSKSEVIPLIYDLAFLRSLVACYLLCTQKSYQEPIDKEFQRRYASVVLELERLNKVCFLHLRMLLYLDWSIGQRIILW